jgi:multicomponent Na+:H+ antiporter subunit G
MIQETIVTIIATAFILIGLVFFLGAAIGLFRFPDFYSRMHAAGKGDTLSSLLIIVGFAIYQLHDFDFTFSHIGEDWVTLLIILKLLAISTFIMITSPTSTHALMDAGWEDGIEPDLKDKKSNALGEDSQSEQ